MPPDLPLVRRRTALTGALGGIAATVLAAGCDTGDDLGEKDATASPSASPSVTQEPERTPDEALVDDVLARLGAAVAVLQAARRFKQLRPIVAPLLHAHRAHAEVLEGDPASQAAASRPAGPVAALEAVRLSESQLQAALVDAAGRADSGALAKLLASMSASTTQHLSTLAPPQQSGGPA
ncbi:MAG: hypothetical protein QOD98_719 [Nocardioidaceae bacterium]|nr:hypothetical protein [Nocardioidaceae bacterium]